MPSTAAQIRQALRDLTGHGVFVPEFTFGNLRIDVLLVDTHHRWIRGFEIKTRREDFVRDRKWTLYSQFCSSLSVVCPDDLLTPNDIGKPFGLLWVNSQNGHPKAQWKQRPGNLQRRNSLAWIWAYVHVLEQELPRLDAENRQLRNEQALWKLGQ